MTDKKHPPRRESGTPPREGNCSTSSPIEGGFRGVCLYFFCSIFYPFLYFQDRCSYREIVFEKKKNFAEKTIPLHYPPFKEEEKRNDGKLRKIALNNQSFLYALKPSATSS